MRVLVVSDTHGRWGRLYDAVLRQPAAEVVIHLGDGEGDMDNVRCEFPDKMMICVSGNCDYMSRLDALGTITLEKRKIFYTHGHIYDVKYGYERVIDAARRREADICLFGHTHQPLTEYRDGLYIMNPGSLGHPDDGQPTCGIIDITNSGIMLNIVKCDF